MSDVAGLDYYRSLTNSQLRSVLSLEVYCDRGCLLAHVFIWRGELMVYRPGYVVPGWKEKRAPNVELLVQWDDPPVAWLQLWCKHHWPCGFQIRRSLFTSPGESTRRMIQFPSTRGQ